MKTVEAMIEIPLGSRNQYKIDSKSGRVKLARALGASVRYPAECGIVERTRYLNGAPLRILVLAGAPTFPGCRIDCRVIGGMDVKDTGEPGVVLLAVSLGDPDYEKVTSMDELPRHSLRDIQRAFACPNEASASGGFFGSDCADRIVDEALMRCAAEQN